MLPLYSIYLLAVIRDFLFMIGLVGEGGSAFADPLSGHPILSPNNNSDHLILQ